MAFEELAGLKKRAQKGNIVNIPKTTVPANQTSLAIFSAVKVPLGQTLLFKMRVFAQAGAARAAYEVTGAIANKGGTTALVGTQASLAFEDTGAWDVKVAANDTKDTLDIQVTSDTSTATIVQGWIEIWSL